MLPTKYLYNIQQYLFVNYFLKKYKYLILWLQYNDCDIGNNSRGWKYFNLNKLMSFL